MKNSLIAAVLVLVAGRALADASPLPMTEQAYEAQKAGIAADYASDRRACGRLQGHAEDLCEVQAKGKRDARLTKLEARYQPDPDRIFEAKMVTAKAHYAIARVKCRALEGNARKRCVRQAKAAREAAERQAVVEKVEQTGGIYGRRAS